MLTFSPLRTDFASFLSDAPAITREMESCLGLVTEAKEDILLLKQRIEDIQLHIHALGVYRNAFIPVARLPVELLQRIFLELALSSRSKPSDVFPEVDIPLRQQDWIDVTWVCKYWREAAASSPPLWTHISCSPSRSSKTALQAIYPRSGTLPLNICCPHLDWTIFRHKDRIQHLHDFQIPGRGELNEHIEASLGVSGIYCFEMPTLESLHVDTSHDNGITESDCTPFLHARVPKLKYLCCSSAVWPLIKSLASQSPLLSLVVGTGNMLLLMDTTLAQWLDLLRNLPALQDLRLADIFLRDLEIPVFESHLPSRQIPLTDLKHLSLSMEGGHPNHLHHHNLPHLIVHLIFPADTKVTITWKSAFDPVSEDHDIERRHSWMLSVAQRMSTTLDPSSGIHRCLQIRSANISLVKCYAETRTELTGYAEGEEGILSVRFTQYFATPTYEQAVSHSFLASPLLSGVSTLSLSDVVVTEHAWSALTVSSLASVTELRLNALNTFVAFLLALEASLENTTAPIFMPLLHTLAIGIPSAAQLDSVQLPPSSRAHWSGGKAGVLQRLVDALVVRRRRGLGPAFVDTGSGPQDVDVALRVPVVDMWAHREPVDSSDEEML